MNLQNMPRTLKNSDYRKGTGKGIVGDITMIQSSGPRQLNSEHSIFAMLYVRNTGTSGQHL